MFTDRRRVLGLMAGSFATPAFAQAPAMTSITAYAFSFAGLEGADIKLPEHAGRPILGEYGVSFPLAAKAQLKGPTAHPFYKWAASERPLETPRWNFHKYLVGRDGHIAAVFPTDIEPMDARVINAIVKELPRPE